MPTYEYECSRHGVFEAVHSMRESGVPQSCPDCGALAARVVITAAAVAGMPRAQRDAHAVNERSAHEPKTSASLRHKPGCSCCLPNAKRSVVVKSRDGSKAFPTKRPWMISH
jgi:putative FmdB family regulatory protein